MSDKPFITCKYDRAFKEIFLKASNKDLLIELLHTCLEEKIEDINILNSEINEGNVHVKRKILDVLVDNDKERINVEINSNTNKYVIERNIAYLCNVHSHNVLRGESYTANKKSIQINLSYGIKEDFIVKRYVLMEDQDYEVLSQNLVLYVFNMDKIKDIWYSKDEKLINKYKYLIMLDLNERELGNLALKDKKVGKYKMELDKVNVTVGINDWISEEKDKEMWKNTYIQEGIEQGLKAVAKNMSKEGMTNEQIASICNISLDEVNVLLVEEEK